MRDFVWKLFSETGDVDVYLLYKEMGEETAAREEAVQDPGDAGDAGDPDF